MPSPAGPTCSMSRAYTGSSARDEPKKVAPKSRAMKATITGCVARKTMPSRRAYSDTPPHPLVTCGVMRMSPRAMSSVRHKPALSVEHQAGPVTANSRPASEGPRISLSPRCALFRAMALVSAARGTRLGTNAWRAGVSRVPARASSADATYREEGATACASVKPARATGTINCALWVPIMRRRRSIASAMRPPSKASAICGTARARSSRPICHRRVRQCIHLLRHGHGRNLTAEPREHHTVPEEAEVTGAQRRRDDLHRLSHVLSHDLPLLPHVAPL